MGKHFFNKYFSLPRKTSVNPKYNYYFFDYSGVRFINLDTNIRYRNKKQLNWLKEVLKQALTNENVHFVVLQFHHPYKSEAWPFGNTKFTGEIEQLLTSTDNPRQTPIVYFNGHTHAYSRGHHKSEINDDWQWCWRQKDYLRLPKMIEQVKVSGDRSTLSVIRHTLVIK